MDCLKKRFIAVDLKRAQSSQLTAVHLFPSLQPKTFINEQQHIIAFFRTSTPPKPAKNKPQKHVKDLKINRRRPPELKKLSSYNVALHCNGQRCVCVWRFSTFQQLTFDSSVVFGWSYFKFVEIWMVFLFTAKLQ